MGKCKLGSNNGMGNSRLGSSGMSNSQLKDMESGNESVEEQE